MPVIVMIVNILNIVLNAKWFAPCVDISPSGHFLIQKKCKPLIDIKCLPKNIPGFFTDVHWNNFGMLNGKFVCFDYQFIGNGVNIAMNTRMLNKLRTKN